MTRLVALILVLGVHTGAFAAPAKSPSKMEISGPVTKSAPQSDQRGTEQTPFVIKLTQTKTAEDQAAKEKKTLQDQTAATIKTYEITRWLAYATIALAVIALWQAFLFRRTIEHSTRSERPELWPSRLRMELLNEAEGRRPKVSYDLINIGKTTGILTELRHDIFIGMPVPRKRKFRKSIGRTGGDIPITSGGGREDEKNSRFHVPPLLYPRVLSDQEIQDVSNGVVGVGFFGYFKYRDNFGFEYEKGFLFHFQGDQNFAPVLNYPNYCYERRRGANRFALKALWYRLEYEYRRRFNPDPDFSPGETKDDFDYY